MFWGDITHGDIVQFEQPEVTIEFDVDRSGAVRSRREAFAEAIAEGISSPARTSPFRGSAMSSQKANTSTGCR